MKIKTVSDYVLMFGLYTSMSSIASFETYQELQFDVGHFIHPISIRPKLFYLIIAHQNGLMQ